jgi:isopenicillin N synthase-like dioxygenase
MSSDPSLFPPLIDLNDPNAPALVDAAYREVGFMQIVGHGIPADVIESAFAAADEFFAQPVEEKVRWESGDPAVERGYSAKGSEAFAYTLDMQKPPDLFEAFSVARDSYPADDPVFAREKDKHNFFAPNIWPDGPDSLRPALTAYYEQVQQLAHRVTTLFARALDLDPDFFVGRTNHSLDTLRVNYFEGAPGDDGPLPEQFGIGPHTDYGILTVLLTDQTPGLQVLDASGEWRPAVPEPGALICNIGDLIAQWTNDRWRSTLHRVAPVMASGAEVVRRRSLPFFHEGNYDMTVECLPTCCSADNPAKYAPVHAGEHVAGKVLSARIFEDAGAVDTVGDRAAALSL